MPAPNLNGISASLTKKTVFYGIVTILTGLMSLIGTLIFGLFGGFTSRLTIDFYQNMNSLYIVSFLILTIAAAILLLTGLYAIRFRRDPEAIRSIVEKVKAALYFEIAGIVVCIIGVALDMGTFMLYFKPDLFAVSLFIGVPIALCMGAVLRRAVPAAAEGGVPAKNTRRSAAWGILSVLAVLNLFVSPVVLVVLNSMA